MSFSNKKFVAQLTIISLLFLLGLYCGLRFGAISYSQQELLTTFLHPFKETATQDVLLDLRLPRVLAAGLVGAAMATAGAIMQGLMRNAIADPGLLGINAGAGLALALGYLFFKSLHYSMILLLCLLGATIAAFLVLALSYQARIGFSSLYLLLAGAMVSALFTALGQGLVTYFKLSPTIIGWQAGGLVGVNWAMLKVIAPFILVGLMLAFILAKQLTILSLGQTFSVALGQKNTRFMVFFLGLVLILSGAAVALVGSLFLVGLIIPHIVKQWTGPVYQKILPLTALLGATFMIWADLLSRFIAPPYETPLISVVSVTCLPYFLWMIHKGEFYD